MIETTSIGKKLKITGLLTAAISLSLGILFAFTFGRSCAFLGSLIIGVCFLAFIAGGVLSVSGFVIEKRSRRSGSENQLHSA
jgi:high-affinity Fe2+/Pb2+ permease